MAKKAIHTVQEKSIEEVIIGLPRNEQIVVKRLRSIVLECLPRATEKVSLGVPFYTHHRMICFIWPPSVFWGTKERQERMLVKGVTLGFCQGNLMSNDEGVLLAEGRKQVYCMYFNTISEMDEAQIRALLFEAELIDERFGKKKRR